MRSRFTNLFAMAVLAMAGTARAHNMDRMSAPLESPDTLGQTLPDLVAEALRKNPSLKAAEYQIKALHSAPSHTWYLEPPQIGVEFYQAPVRSFPNPLKNQNEIDYSIQQSFPFPGKIGSRIQAEHKHAEMSEADFESLKRKVIREVKTDYFELYLLDRRMEINQESQALMRRLTEIARRQYEVGIGRQSDVLKAQTELTTLRTDSVALSQDRLSMTGMLNALLNRRVESPLRVAAIPDPAHVDFTFAQLQPLLDKEHPSLKAMNANIQMREAEKTVAKKDFLPDFMVSSAYKNMLSMPEGAHGGTLQDYWSVMVSMNLPLAFWSLPKYRAGLIQNDANIGEAREEYADMRNMVYARAQQALTKAKSGEELVRLSRTVLLPQSEQTLESNQSAYQSGKSEFMTLLDAYRTRLMARENTEMAVMQLLSSQAELEEAVGLNLDEIRRKISEGEQK